MQMRAYQLSRQISAGNIYLCTHTTAPFFLFCSVQLHADLQSVLLVPAEALENDALNLLCRLE